MIKSQSGVTLISLLIGLLIAMLCMIGLLSAYRTIAKTGVESRMDATHDTQLQNGLIASQMMIQNAGFGLEGDTNLKSANIMIGSNSTPALLWRYKVGGTVSCQGLADIADSSKRKLVTLTASTGCDDTSVLDTLTWETDKTLAHLTNFSGGTNNQQVTYKVEPSTVCTTFGSVNTGSGQHPQVTLSAKTSTQQHNSGLGSIQVPICILNITS